MEQRARNGRIFGGRNLVRSLGVNLRNVGCTIYGAYYFPSLLPCLRLFFFFFFHQTFVDDTSNNKIDMNFFRRRSYWAAVDSAN